jgi:hypothetical protein
VSTPTSSLVDLDLSSCIRLLLFEIRGDLNGDTNSKMTMLLVERFGGDALGDVLAVGVMDSSASSCFCSGVVEGRILLFFWDFVGDKRNLRKLFAGDSLALFGTWSSRTLPRDIGGSWRGREALPLWLLLNSAKGGRSRKPNTILMHQCRGEGWWEARKETMRLLMLAFGGTIIVYNLYFHASERATLKKCVSVKLLSTLCSKLSL